MASFSNSIPSVAVSQLFLVSRYTNYRRFSDYECHGIAITPVFGFLVSRYNNILGYNFDVCPYLVTGFLRFFNPVIRRVGKKRIVPSKKSIVTRAKWVIFRA